MKCFGETMEPLLFGRFVLGTDLDQFSLTSKNLSSLCQRILSMHRRGVFLRRKYYFAPHTSIPHHVISILRYTIAIGLSTSLF